MPPPHQSKDLGGVGDELGVFALNTLPDGKGEGYLRDKQCWGTYMHGILDNPVVLNDLARDFGKQPIDGFDYRKFKEEQYDLLAGYVRAAVDMDYIYSTIKL